MLMECQWSVNLVSNQVSIKTLIKMWIKGINQHLTAADAFRTNDPLSVGQLNCKAFLPIFKVNLREWSPFLPLCTKGG